MSRPRIETDFAIYRLQVTPRWPNVNVSITVEPKMKVLPKGVTYRDWTMLLQRRGSGGWNTIGTRTGYCEAGDDSHRTFTNVKKQGAMRVYVNFRGGPASEYMIKHID